MLDFEFTTDLGGFNLKHGAVLIHGTHNNKHYTTTTYIIKKFLSEYDLEYNVHYRIPPYNLMHQGTARTPVVVTFVDGESFIMAKMKML